MACNCGKKRGAASPAAQPAAQSVLRVSATQKSELDVKDADMVLIRYNGHDGGHRVFGMATNTFYGRRTKGDMFLVHKKDVELQPHLFKPVEHVEVQQAARPEPPAPTPAAVPDTEAATVPEAPAKPAVKVFDLGMIPGVTAQIAMQLQADGVHTKEQVIALGVAGLTKYKGIGESRAKAILGYLAQD